MNHLLTPRLRRGKILNSNIEIPAFAGAASRRQAKQIKNFEFPNSKLLVPLTLPLSPLGRGRE